MNQRMMPYAANTGGFAGVEIWTMGSLASSEQAGICTMVAVLSIMVFGWVGDKGGCGGGGQAVLTKPCW